MATLSDDHIREAAYHIWLAEGCPEGRDQDHWEQAKAVLSASAKPARKRAPAKKATAAKPRAKKA